MQAVQTVRPSGVFAKVNRVRFSLQGNKFGACDGDGNVALWQAANASAPFFVSSMSIIVAVDELFVSRATSWLPCFYNKEKRPCVPCVKTLKAAQA